MATAGYTSEPTYGSEWWGSLADNQHCINVTMPVDGRVTYIGCWLRGKDASCSFKGAVWSNTRDSVLGQTGSQTASGAALAVGASLLYNSAVLSPFDVASGYVLYVGFCRNPTGAMQFGFNNSSPAHYDDYNASSNPSGMSGESSHSTRQIGMYITYETVPEVYLRRSSAWVQTSAVYVRRSSAWSTVGPDVYIRRSGAWVKA